MNSLCSMGILLQRSSNKPILYFAQSKNLRNSKFRLGSSELLSIVLFPRIVKASRQQKCLKGKLHLNLFVCACVWEKTELCFSHLKNELNKILSFHTNLALVNGTKCKSYSPNLQTIFENFQWKNWAVLFIKSF